MKKYQRPLAVFFVSLILFLVDFDLPNKPVFDEAHYLPAAQAIWNLVPNGNYEHPPLAKELMGFGQWLTGMDLNGARLMSILFGAFACVAFYLISAIVLEDEDWALLAIVLAWLNGVAFVLARIAMLEIFLSCFLLWAVFYFLRALKSQRMRDHIFSALFVGAAVACKWYAIIPWVYLMIGAQVWGRNDRFKMAAAYALFPVAIYALTYIPIWIVGGPGFSVKALVQMQLAMYEAQKMTVVRHSEYSQWWTWPFKLKPQWLLRDVTETEGKLDIQSIILLGNPLILWAGVASLVYFLSEIHERAEAALAPLYLALLLPWIVIPRMNTFYYYYFPLTWIVTLAAADTMKRFWEFDGRPARVFVRAWLALAGIMFFYHWPLFTGWRMSMDGAEAWYPYLF